MTREEAETARRVLVTELEVDRLITQHLRRTVRACDEGIDDAETEEQRDYLASIVMKIREAGVLLNNSIDKKSARLVQLSQVLEGPNARTTILN